MNKTWPILLWTPIALVGAVLLLRAANLSVAYNAWTTSLRQKPSDFRPPTEQALKDNTRIMKWLLRLMGAFFLFLASMAVINIWYSR